MTDIEDAIATARVLLNEVTRQYKTGRGVGSDEILVMVANILKPHGLGHTFNAPMNDFGITKIREG